MIAWEELIYFAVPAILFSLFAAWSAYKERQILALVLALVGISILGIYIGLMWYSLQRPPMRTMGETRLWYSFFALLAGVIVYLRWHYKWLLAFSTVLAAVFIVINIAKPEIHNKSMMPALESPYFVPHVVSYMFSYAMLGAALLLTIYVAIYQKKITRKQQQHIMHISDNMVYTGLSFLMVGLLLGAIWAKQAWGHYWSWDPKETWAAITMLVYLVYIHFRMQNPRQIHIALFILIIAFLCLQICWYGVNFLPSAAGVSIHTYGA